MRKGWCAVSATCAVAILLAGLVSAGPVSATMLATGTIASGEFTYLGGSPTKWDSGPDTASFHGFIPPAGPMLPGGASWSVMPLGTLSDGFDPHGGAGSPTVGGPAGSVMFGAHA